MIFEFKPKETNMINVGIVGSEGYVVGELYSLLIYHPDVNLRMIYAPMRKGIEVAELFNDLHSVRSLTFTDEANFEDLDLLFICLPSGLSRTFMNEHTLPDHLKVIDFSQEHRHNVTEGSSAYVYGLPEAYRRGIIDATRVAVPGSYAIAVETPLIPMAKHLMLNSDLHINSVAGKTESFARPDKERSLTYDVIFDIFQVNKPFYHHHQEEILLTLQDLQKSFNQEVNLIPMRGGFNRGIYTTTYMNSGVDLAVLRELYEEYFESHSFVRIVDHAPDVRDTLNTNCIQIHLSKHNDKLLITSTMDNLLKGAAGNAVHIMNLMFDLVETTGLQIKPAIF